MDIYRKLAILFIVILFSIILFRLIQRRADIRSQFIETFSEGLSDCSDGVKKANTIAPNISNVPSNYLKKPLNQFYIKSAYGGGFNGTDICPEMMLYTLSLGYRYVYINVFYDIVNMPNKDPSTNKTAVVGLSGSYPMTNFANHTMALSDFLPLIQQNAFSSTSPNSADPFFLHIIPAYQMSGPEDNTNSQEIMGFNTQLNTQIEQALSVLQGSNRTSGPIQPTTTLDEIKGKLVIVMDAVSTQGYMTSNLKNMVALNVPSSYFMGAKNLVKTKKPFISVLPFDESGSLLTSIPNYIDLYSTYRINTTPVCVWESRFIGSSLIGKSNLGDYESLFANEGGSAFIPLII